MNSKQLSYVVQIAEDRSFSIAAHRLYVSQPALSETIKRIETEIGYPLFDRSVVPLRLTAAGEAYVRTAREILSLERSLDKQLQDLDDEQYGTLAIGVTPSSGMLPAALRRFLEIYPHYKVILQDSVRTAEQLKMLEQGQLDICVHPINDSHDQRFSTELIASDRLVLILPADSPVNDSLRIDSEQNSTWPEIDLQELRKIAGIPFISAGEGLRLRTRVNRLFERLNLELMPQIVCFKSEGCLELVRSGLGAAVVQQSLIRFQEPSHRLKYYLIRQNFEEINIAAVYLRGRYLKKAERAFIDILKSF